MTFVVGCKIHNADIFMEICFKKFIMYDCNYDNQKKLNFKEMSLQSYLETSHFSFDNQLCRILMHSFGIINDNTNVDDNDMVLNDRFEWDNEREKIVLKENHDLYFHVQSDHQYGYGFSIYFCCLPNLLLDLTNFTQMSKELFKCYKETYDFECGVFQVDEYEC